LGDGTERKRLIALVDELKISEYVDLLGNQDDMPKYYSGMDAFVMTSRIEGLSVAYLEAQAEGLPVFMAKGLPLGNPVSRLVSTIDLSMNDSDIARQILSARSTPRLPGTREVADNGYDANNLKTILESKIDEVFRS
jgi:glycosyltransferase involved in cell wall biosynthesis